MRLARRSAVVRIPSLVSRSALLAAAAFAMAATPLAAQQPRPTPNITSHPDWPAATPADVSSEDAILKALYDVISGDKGVKRDWNRMRSLFVPGARLMPSVPRDSGRRADLLIWSVDEYITFAGPQLEAGGFHERELHRVTERYGNVVQVFSTYDSKRTLQDEKPFARGINSIQLLKDGGRYWVVSIFWDSERPGNPIPAAYLP